MISSSCGYCLVDLVVECVAILMLLSTPMLFPSLSERHPKLLDCSVAEVLPS